VGHVGGDGLHRIGIDRVQLLDRAVEKQAGRELVDAARHAARMAVDLGICLGIDDRAAVPAGQLQPVDDIGLDLVLAHRVEMMRGDDPLAKLLQAFAGKLFANSGWPSRKIWSSARPPI
jgi:hypothetical protein